jgi:hypothetical protein
MFWSGYCLDVILGGNAVKCAWDAQSRQPKFDQYFHKLNTWGIKSESLTKLMRPVLSDGEAVVAELIQSLRNIWNRFDGSNNQKAFRILMATRVRYHLAGAMHRMSFLSWPIVPYLDLPFISRMLQLPPDAVVHRRLQHQLLQTQFPGLADVPLDTNSFYYESSSNLVPISAGRVRTRLLNARKSLRTWYWLKLRKTEPRRYRRLFDPDQPDWKVIRRAAEPHRDALLDWLDPEEFARLVPAPDVDLQFADPFSAGAPLRNLCGLMFWKASAVSQFKRAA